MKKLFVFLGVLAMSAGVVFAQDNEAESIVTGNDNVADVTQLGSDNEAKTVQDGTENEAIVDQTGDDNRVSDVYQEGYKNTADVQQGDFGGGDKPSNNALAKIRQVGDRNDATIKQRQGYEGGTAESVHEIKQMGHDNEAFLETFNGDNFGKIHQEGNMNYAKGRQSVGSNELDIKQFGTDNWANVEQLESDGAYAKIHQDGYDNWAEILQEEETSDNWAKIHVEGDRNTTSIIQESDNNWAKINSVGHDNTVNIVQD